MENEKPESEKPKPKRPRGTGSIFFNGSRATLWISYPNGRGKNERENAHTLDERVAEKLLRRRLGEVAADRYVPPATVRVDELVEDVIGDYTLNQRRSVEHVIRRWKLHLSPWFSKRKAREVSPGMIRRYVDSRVEQGAKPASVNRELAILRRAFTLGRKAEKVAVIPFIQLFRENNRRVGFLETQQEVRLANECARFGLWMRTAFEIGLTYGWRLAEVQGLRVRQVNLLRRTLSLDVGTTKNDAGRTVVLTPKLFKLLCECVRDKQPTDYVLTRVVTGRDGKAAHSPVLNFRKAWHRACIRAELGKLVCPACKGEKGETFAVDENHTCPNCSRKWKCHEARYRGLLFHDLRRSMARNARNEGIAPELIMEIGGWKTANVFRRYSIVNPADTAAAILRVDARRQKEQATVKSQAPESVAEPFIQSFIQSAQKPVQSATSRSRKLKATVLPN